MAKEKVNGTQEVKATDKPAWFKVGDDGLKEKKKQDAIAKNKREKSVPRFRLGEGEEAVIVFVDDVGFYAKIHQFELDGSWGNFATCVKDFEPCAICNAGKKPVYTAHYTIIDTRSFTRKDGTVIKNTKVLFPAKGSAINIIADLKKKYGSLVGYAFKVKRYSKNDPNCGNFFELVKERRINLVKSFGPDADKPYDYYKVLAPPTPEELADLGFGSFSVGSSADIKVAENLEEIFGE
jgi:hypothetical protein